MGVRSWLVDKLAGDIIQDKVNSSLNVFRYEIPGKEINMPRLAMFRLREYKVWAEGNPVDLMMFYGTYNIVPGEQGSDSRQLFWEWVKGVNNVPKLHFPTPEIIMNQMKSLIFADDLEVNVIVKNDKGEEIERDSKEMTDLLLDILKENDINEKYQTGCLMETYSGSLSYKPVFDEDVSEYPIIVPYPAEKIKLRAKLGKIYEVIYEDEYKYEKKRYRLKSHYGKGYIQYKLWLLDSSGNEKEIVPIETIPELKDNHKDVIITLDGKQPIPILLAPFKKNRTKSNEFMDTEYGGSDFQGITDSFQLIDELYSQKNLYIRRARPMITMSDRFLKKDSNNNDIIPKEYENDTVIIRGDEATNNINKPERDLPDLNLTPYDDSIKEEIKNCWLKIGMSYTTVGLEANSANASGASLEIKERSTIIVRSNKIKLWDSFLQRTYQVLMIFNSLKNAKVTEDDETITYKIDNLFDYDYKIEFPVYNNQTFEEKLNEAIKARNGGIYDTKAAVDHALREKYTEEQKEEIVKNVKIENGIPLIGNELGGNDEEV